MLHSGSLVPAAHVFRARRVDDSAVYVRTKICGITRLEDAEAAVALGADALGFVFWPNSPRNIAPDRAAVLIRRLPPFVTSVALLVDPSADDVQRARDAGCVLLQFHGDESPASCAVSGAAWIKAVRVMATTDIGMTAKSYAAAGACGVLLAAHVAGVPGGTGQRFDWSLVPKDMGVPIILAGGLTPDNVGDAIRTVRPYAVDVSGGVESAKGIKNHARMAAFLSGVRRVCKED